MNQYQSSIKYIAVGSLLFLSFLVCYSSFHSAYYPGSTQDTKDKLSGEGYAPIVNEKNPYAPYTVGFDTLIDRGVSRDEMRYINDVLTNFTLYDAKIYKAKVSYVKDSFKRNYNESSSTTYSFKFGVNDSNINTMVVDSNPLNDKIAIKINNSNNKTVFNRNFVVYR